MEKVLHSSLGLPILIIIACFILAFIGYLAWPKKKPCQVCKKTFHFEGHDFAVLNYDDEYFFCVEL